MSADASEPQLIPSAPFDDLDLDREDDYAIWEARLMEVAAARITAARVRLESLGIIGPDGRPSATELPPDMLPGADTTLETG
jgi:hypothetical protein